ncbi:hypothetical protein AQF52_7894 [Streptomyces venezuelae]|nr:hypothetical protein AQF52_7894 [Streptomyces venezuelae]CUM35789.1 hypothetical protein BN2537_543 [Streptomyces venezuelae]
MRFRPNLSGINSLMKTSETGEEVTRTAERIASAAGSGGGDFRTDSALGPVRPIMWGRIECLLPGVNASFILVSEPAVSVSGGTCDNWKQHGAAHDMGAGSLDVRPARARTAGADRFHTVRTGRGGSGEHGLGEAQ